MRSLNRYTLSALLALTALLTPALALADHESETTVTVYPLGPLLTTTTTTIGVIVAASIVTSPFTTTSSTSRSLFGSHDQTRDYLNENAVALQQDISMGGGAHIDDLATMAQLTPPQRAALGRLMRRHREPLQQLLASGRVDDEGAALFTTTLEAAMREDALLAPLAMR